MRVTVSRKAHFNAAHRLYRSDWSDKKNQSIFGKCSNEFFHGHNYELIVNVTGKIDPVTGFVIDIKVLKDIIKTEVEDSLTGLNTRRYVEAHLREKFFATEKLTTNFSVIIAVISLSYNSFFILFISYITKVFYVILVLHYLI